MKIAILSSLWEPQGYGGAERVAQGVAESLAAQGHEVHAICLGPSGRGQEARLNSVQVHYRPLRNLYWPFPVAAAPSLAKVAWHAIDAHNFAMARMTGELLDEIRPDLVNTHNIAGFSAAIWPAVSQRGLPLIHTLHDHYLFCPYSTMFKDGENCARPCLACRVATVPRRAMTHHVDAVIGVSRFILDRHLRDGLFPEAHASVVYNGYDAPDGPPGAGARAAGGPLRVGYMGGLVTNKGLDRLLDAYLELPQGAAELRIAGAGDARFADPLKARSASRQDVHWRGVVRPEDFMPELDVLVVPSRVHEAMGRVVVEAFAHGVPVIAARRGGIPELFRGDCGWLYEPDDRAQLPGILKQILGQRGELAAKRAAARSAAGHFSRAAMIAGYLAAYREAAAR